MLQCPKAQPCHNVCQQPNCTWSCGAPKTCPKPECNLQCDTPATCTGTTFREMPPLGEGETLVQSFAVPQALQRSLSNAGGGDAQGLPQAAQTVTVAAEAATGSSAQEARTSQQPSSASQQADVMLAQLNRAAEPMQASQRSRRQWMVEMPAVVA